MIASLTGTVISLTPGVATLQVGPVGLEVLVPGSLMGRLALGETTSLVTHTHVTDSAISLFGFASEADRAFFRELLTVSGVGPKSALAILALDPAAVRQAVLAGDVETLAAIPGLGKKRAQRLVLELANRLTEAPEAPKKGAKKPPAHPLEAALTPALEKLGYDRDEIRTMLAELPPEHATPEAALQHMLKHAR